MPARNRTLAKRNGPAPAIAAQACRRPRGLSARRQLEGVAPTADERQAQEPQPLADRTLVVGHAGQHVRCGQARPLQPRLERVPVRLARSAVRHGGDVGADLPRLKGRVAPRHQDGEVVPA